MVLVSEGLTDDDGIRIAQFGEDLLPRASGEKVGIAMGAPDVQVGGSERSGHVFIADFVSADRKSTRLNSSHRCISYAVFCLKKKKQTPGEQRAASALPLELRARRSIVQTFVFAEVPRR